jgi:hypothetical protein
LTIPKRPYKDEFKGSFELDDEAAKKEVYDFYATYVLDEIVRKYAQVNEFVNALE